MSTIEKEIFRLFLDRDPKDEKELKQFIRASRIWVYGEFGITTA